MNASGLEKKGQRSDSGLMHTSAAALERLLDEWVIGTGPAHRKLAERIRLLILDGRLPLGSTLPGERDLAVRLGISRTTVSTAYTTLGDQGYLNAQQRARSTTTVPSTTHTGHHAAEITKVTGSASAEVIDFAHASPAAPGVQLHHAFMAALEQLPRHLPHHGYAQIGLPELRAAVADRYRARGLPTTPEQILITTGAQHALSLLVRIFVRPGCPVVVDHPSYPHALHLLRDARARLVPVPLTDTGWDFPALTAATRNAKLAYLIPDFHNPTGLSMSDSDRQTLQLGCLTIVDETMADLALDIEPPAPLAAHHRQVISIGSVSKVFWGGLRIGWVRADPSIIRRLAQARAGYDLGTPVLEQLACVELLRHIDTILPDRLTELIRNRNHLYSLIGQHLPKWSITPGTGGLALWATMPGPISSALATIAPRFGLRLAAGPRFGVGGAFERNMRLTYCLEPSKLDIGIRALVDASSAIETNPRTKETHPTPFA